jgi:D-alanyl-D-alanine carboxypeptidase
MRFRLVIIGLVLSLCLASQPASAVRYASIVVDERTGAVLHAENPDRRSFPASLTKIMTLYMIFEALKTGRLSPDQELPVSKRASRRPKSKLWLKKGQKIKVKDVIGALITKSANDAATVVAEAIGGSEEQFARMMTARAHQIGMTHTNFRNASGLPNKHQVSTARDMAKLAMALRRDFPNQFNLFSMKDFKYRGRKHRNHNRLLGRFAGTDGIKTGYVRASGYNIVVSVERGGRRLIAVVFGGKSAAKRDLHVKKLLQRTFRTIAENDRIEASQQKIAAKKALKPAAKSAQSSRSASQKVSIARITAETSGVPEEELALENWSVQVGAFDRFAPAHLAAGRAARLAPMLRGARVVVETGASTKQRIYRARLAGLTEGRAIRACRTLKKKKMSCLVVREESGIAQGDRN